MRSAESFHSIWNRSSRFIEGFLGFLRRFLGFCGWGERCNKFKFSVSLIIYIIKSVL